MTLLYKESNPVASTGQCKVSDSTDLIDQVDLEKLLKDVESPDCTSESVILKKKSLKCPLIHANSDVSAFIKCVTKAIEGIT